MKSLLRYGLLFVLAGTLRFAYLHVLPPALTHDELDLAIQAQSVRLTGRDLSGTWTPWSFLPNDAMMAELAPLVNVPAYTLLGNSLFAAHATDALLGALYPLLLVAVLIAWGMSQKTAWFAGVLIAISPWHVLFSRTSFEQPVSLFCYTLAWLFLAKVFAARPAKHTMLPLLGFAVAYFLGFFSYHGYKFSLPLVTGLAILVHTYQTRAWRRALAPLLIILVGYGWIAVHYQVYRARQGEVGSYSTAELAQRVESSRKQNLLPPRVQALLDNKATALLEITASKVSSLTSSHTLYQAGEDSLVFATGRTGYLYYVLIPFLLFGAVTSMRKRQGSHLLVLSLMMCGAIPMILHINDSLAFRAAPYLVGLTILAALGLEPALATWGKHVAWSVLGIGLVWGLGQFIYIYFGSYALVGARAHFFADRLTAAYLTYQPRGQVLVLDPQPRYLMSELILARPTVTRESLSPLLGHFDPDEAKNTYQVGNVTIRRDCPPADEVYDTVIVDYVLEGSLEKCPALRAHQGSPVHALADPLDSGTTKRIYNDQLCPDVTRTYLRPTSLATFALESLSRVQFCENWIVKP